jgi:hypothetical protein
MVNRVLLFSTLAGMTVLTAIPVFAAKTSEEPTQHWLSVFESDLTKAEDVLRHKPKAEWTKEEVEVYLFNAMYAVDYATIVYIDRNKQHPLDEQVLKDSGLLSHWPANPLRDWEPIRILSKSDEFSAGDIVKQLCGPELYSGLTNPVPLTYMITINGPSKDYDPSQPVKSLFTWATVPSGSVFVGGSKYMTSAEKRKKLAEREELQRKAK